MDGEWADVKVKKKKAPKQQAQGPAGSSYGGVTAKGTLVAGPIQQTQSAYASRYGGDAWTPSSSKYEVVNHASAVADYDFGVDEEPRAIKYETYSHTCSSAVANARIEAQMTQAQLATKVNERPSTIVELENGTGRYDASLVNRIENALKVQINRGRATKGKGKK